MKPDNTPENVKKLRLKAGLTQKECSHIYGVGLRTWQKKEEVNTQNSQSLSLVEFEFLLLLAGEHPEYVLCKMLMYAYISINIEQILARCARSSLTLTRAVQRPAMLQCTRAG